MFDDMAVVPDIYRYEGHDTSLHFVDVEDQRNRCLGKESSFNGRNSWTLRPNDEEDAM